jgi:hypothetical protein
MAAQHGRAYDEPRIAVDLAGPDLVYFSAVNAR